MLMGFHVGTNSTISMDPIRFDGFSEFKSDGSNSNIC